MKYKFVLTIEPGSDEFWEEHEFDIPAVVDMVTQEIEDRCELNVEDLSLMDIEIEPVDNENICYAISKRAEKE